MSDHRVVVLLIGGKAVFQLLCVMLQEGLGACYGFRGNIDLTHIGGIDWPPGALITPVDVGTIAAAVGATVATATEKSTRSDIEAFACNLPIVFLGVCIHSWLFLHGLERNIPDDVATGRSKRPAK